MNAKERKPGCVEISMGWWEVVVCWARVVVCLHFHKQLSFCLCVTVAISCVAIWTECRSFFFLTLSERLCFPPVFPLGLLFVLLPHAAFIYFPLCNCCLLLSPPPPWSDVSLIILALEVVHACDAKLSRNRGTKAHFAAKTLHTLSKTCMTPVIVAGRKMCVCGNTTRYCASVCNRPALSSQYNN